MRSKFIIFIIILSVFTLGCKIPNSSEPENKTLKRYGTIATDEKVRGPNFDEFVFSLEGSKRASDFNCEEGDYVYFEAERGYSNKNHNGGTTYWCKLIFMKIHQL